MEADTMRGARRFEDLEVYQRAFELSMQVFEISKTFPKEETYSMTDQIRKASRSVAAHISEAWEHRSYEAAFFAKITGGAGEAAETQNWLRYVAACKYAPAKRCKELFDAYDGVLKTLRAMALHSASWCSKAKATPQRTATKRQRT